MLLLFVPLLEDFAGALQVLAVAAAALVEHASEVEGEQGGMGGSRENLFAALAQLLEQMGRQTDDHHFVEHKVFGEEVHGVRDFLAGELLLAVFQVAECDAVEGFHDEDHTQFVGFLGFKGVDDYGNAFDGEARLEVEDGNLALCQHGGDTHDIEKEKPENSLHNGLRN